MNSRDSKVQDKIIETLLNKKAIYKPQELLAATGLKITPSSFYRSINNLIGKQVLIKRGHGLKTLGRLQRQRYEVYYLNEEILNVEKWQKFNRDDVVSDGGFFLTLDSKMTGAIVDLRKLSKTMQQIKEGLIDHFPEKARQRYLKRLTPLLQECSKLVKLIESEINTKTELE